MQRECKNTDVETHSIPFSGLHIQVVALRKGTMPAGYYDGANGRHINSGWKVADTNSQGARWIRVITDDELEAFNEHP